MRFELNVLRTPDQLAWQGFCRFAMTVSDLAGDDCGIVAVGVLNQASAAGGEVVGDGGAVKCQL